MVTASAEEARVRQSPEAPRTVVAGLGVSAANDAIVGFQAFSAPDPLLRISSLSYHIHFPHKRHHAIRTAIRCRRRRVAFVRRAPGACL